MSRRGAHEDVGPEEGLEPVRHSAAGVVLGLVLELRGDARRHSEKERAEAPRRVAREDFLDRVLLHMRCVGAVGEGVALLAIDRGFGADGRGSADDR